jgi:hypothetical protein
MRLDFPSCLDQKFETSMRPALDAVFVLDISGSMESYFQNDDDSRRKLEVAVSCIESIFNQMTERDRAGIVIFNTEAKEVSKLSLLTPARKCSIIKVLKKIHASGGTKLATGLQAGYSTLKGKAMNAANEVDASEKRLKRVFFLTDMISSAQDEEEVIAITEREALISCSQELTSSSSSSSGKKTKATAAKLPSSKAHAGSKRGKRKLAEAESSDVSAGDSYASGSSTERKIADQELQESQFFDTGSSPSRKRARVGNGTAAPSMFDILGSWFAGLFGSKTESAEDNMHEDEEEERTRDAAYAANSSNVPTDGYHITLIGIEVDLSVATVERLSAIPGARYVSAVRAEELFETLANDFTYDVTPIAFNIEVSLPPEYAFKRIMGSSELDSVTEGARMARISTEFPVPLERKTRDNERGIAKGGTYLCKFGAVLDTEGASDSTSSSSSSSSRISKSFRGVFSRMSTRKNNKNLQLIVRWTDLDGVKRKCKVPMNIPPALEVDNDVLPAYGLPPATSADHCDIGLRKAVALAEYVTELTSYVIGNDEDAEDDDDDDDCDDEDDGPFSPFGSSPNPFGSPFSTHQQPSISARLARPAAFEEPHLSASSADFLRSLSAEGVAGLHSLEDLPSDTPKSICRRFVKASKFLRLRAFLLREMATCDDVTLSTANQNILQTVTQIAELETEALRRVMRHLPPPKEKVERTEVIELLDDDDDDDISKRPIKREPALQSATSSSSSSASRATSGSEAVPRGYTCPITLTLMNDPVIAADGHSYERSAIEEWIRACRNNAGRITSPSTNLVLPHTHLVSNHSLAQAIQDYRDERGLPVSERESDDPPSSNQQPPRGFGVAGSGFAGGFVGVPPRSAANSYMPVMGAPRAVRPPRPILSAGRRPHQTRAPQGRQIRPPLGRR